MKHEWQERKVATNEKTDALIFNLWWSLNYGAILTAYALQESLRDFGYKSKLVHFMQDWCRPLFAGSFAEDFARRRLQVTKPIESYEDVIGLNDEADTFIVGSDQVFRQQYNQQQGFLFFLPFADAEKKKIACAASFGVDYLEGSKNDNRLKKYYLSLFDAVSVRESSGADICRRDLACLAEQISDPVFWLSAERWSKLAADAELDDKDFVFSYVLDKKDKNNRVCDCLRKKFADFRVVDLGDGQKREHRAISPEAWLYYIKNCRYMITDSFHAAAMAVIFNKPFICLANKKRGISRLRDMFADFGLSARLVFDDDDIGERKDLFESPDYARVNQIVAEKASFAREWMRQAMARPKMSLPPEREAFAFFVQQLDMQQWKMNEQNKQLGEVCRLLFKFGAANFYKRRIWYYKFVSLFYSGKKRKKYKIKCEEWQRKLSFLKKTAKFVK